MDCQEATHSKLAEEYLQGRLDPARQDEFEVHILECEKCLRVVEALQATRHDLAIRAHEIRVYSASRGRLRWSLVAVAVLILLVSGVITRQLLQHQTPGTGVAHQKPQEPGAPGPGTPEKTPSSSFETVSKGVEPAPVPLPGTPPSPVLNAGIPKKSSPSPKIQKPDTENKSTPLAPVVATNPENPVPESHVAGAPETTIATLPTGAKGSPHIAAGTPSDLMSDDGEKELFRLSAVRAVPYDFSGVSVHGDVSPGSGAWPGLVRHSGEQRALFERAMRAYVDRNYDETIDLLQQARNVEPNAADINFYLGVAFLLEGRPDQALAPLKIAAADQHTRWAQPAHFYLAKAYLQTRDLASAEAELKAAAATAGSLTASARTDLSSLRALRVKENR